MFSSLQKIKYNMLYVIVITLSSITVGIMFSNLVDNKYAANSYTDHKCVITNFEVSNTTTCVKGDNRFLECNIVVSAGTTVGESISQFYIITSCPDTECVLKHTPSSEFDCFEHNGVWGIDGVDKRTKNNALYLVSFILQFFCLIVWIYTGYRLHQNNTPASSVGFQPVNTSP